MKKNYKTFFTSLILTTFLFFTTISYSQLPPGFDDDVEDEAPITSLIVAGLIVGSIFGIKKLKK